MIAFRQLREDQSTSDFCSLVQHRQRLDSRSSKVDGRRHFRVRAVSSSLTLRRAGGSKSKHKNKTRADRARLSLLRKSLNENGAPCWNRTSNPVIKSHLLCQLS